MFLQFLYGTNLGFNKTITQSNWLDSLSQFIPEILIISSIMILIM